jgi:hypothetical protein
MSKRSFAMGLLFVLGCGGSLLAGLALAGSGYDQGFLDNDLQYTDDGAGITFTDTGMEGGYWIVADGKIAPPLSNPSDSAFVVRENLKTVKVYKITPVASWELGLGFRPCRPDLHDCPLPYKPLPPPPPPILPGGAAVEQYVVIEGRH